MSKDNKEMELWSSLKASNSKNLDEIKKMMLAVGYTKGEVENLLKKKIESYESTSVAQIKENIKLRSNIRTKLMFEHIDRNNLLSVMHSSREEDRQLLESLVQIGELTPVSTESNNIGLMSVENLVYQIAQEDKLPELDVPSNTED